MHVDAVMVASLHLRERVRLVAHIHLQHVIVYIDVQVFLWQAQIGRRAMHVTADTTGVCRTIHQYLPRSE